VLDRPRTGTIIAGIGLAGLVLVWAAQVVLVLRDRQEARR
jgi:hypothetical protein